MRRRDRADNADTNADSLTAEQAAAELGVSARTVQRYISVGTLSGTQRPCRTTRAALRAYQARQQGLAGRIGPAQDTVADNADSRADNAGGAALDTRTRAETVPTEAGVSVPLSFIERLLVDLRRLEREVGRLEAELAQCTCSGQASARRTPTADRRPGAQRGGVWGRMGLWLRGRGTREGDCP